MEDIVKTVVIPSEILAGVASIDIQNDTCLRMSRESKTLIETCFIIKSLFSRSRRILSQFQYEIHS